MPTKDQIKRAALELNVAEREALAEELLLSIEGTDRDTIDAAWLDEIRQLDDRFRAGESQGQPMDQVIGRLMHKAGR